MNELVVRSGLNAGWAGVAWGGLGWPGGPEGPLAAQHGLFPATLSL